MANPFVSKDGSKHTNHDSMKRADARFGAKQPQGAAGASDDYNSGAEDELDNEPQDGASMAAEHGPAIETTLKHDHEAGTHQVHAVHPDGHEHDTEHGSADEAHQYAADCAGVGQSSGMGGGM
jgi:hypothetical protein